MTDEQWQIQRFVELSEIAPDAKLEFGDQPDALVFESERIIGIEHTRLIRPPEEGSDLRAYEAITDQIVERAQELAENQGVKRLHVFAHFDESVKLYSRDIEATARKIAEFVCHNEPPNESEVIIEGWNYTMRALSFPDSVKRLAIKHRAAWQSPLWQVPRTSGLPPLTRAFVQGRVKEKEDRLPVYRSNCDEIWLLLVVEGFAPSGTWDLNRFEYDQPIPTSFDRLFLYDQFRADPRELRLKPT